MKISPVVLLSIASAFLLAACIREPEPFCITYKTQRYAPDTYRMAIIYQADTGWVHLETTEPTWSKQVRLHPGSVAVLLVDLDRSEPTPEPDIEQIHPPTVTARIIHNETTQSRMGSWKVPAKLGLGIPDTLYRW